MRVLSVRYWETRRGVGYECKTDIKGVSIWNDGMGGDTYVAPNGEDKSEATAKALKRLRVQYDEWQLEDLINQFEFKS